MNTNRRVFAQSLAGSLAGSLAVSGLAVASATAAAAVEAPPARLPTLLPRRLQPGDTVGIVSPANATYERDPMDFAVETLQALGFKVKLAPHARARWGQFAGQDVDRAGDINAMFADDSIAGIFAMTGGSGCNRIVDKLDYALIRRKPKYFGGYSDLTCLVNAMQRKTGLVTFHAPVASSEWNGFSADHFKALVMNGETALLQNPSGERGDNLIQREDRTVMIRPGKARGVLVGGNLAVLTSLAGTPYFPDCRGAILFIEEVNEYLYRCDRMLSTLRLLGVLDQVAGVVIGKFTHCEPGEGYGVLTLDEIFEDYFGGLKVPVYRGAMIGHIKRKFTLPVGGMVEMDADAGTLQVLSPAVRA
ncbi:MAG: LD-carboxypeptidase [Paucibacter sp.]|nr:LD-carboxypeptidase [Roseateles sp.]